MPNQLIAMEMALAVQRERMEMIAKDHHREMIAQGGRNGTPVRRAISFASASVRRMGRPFGWGSAPTVGARKTISQSELDRARIANQAVSTARF